MAFFTNDICNVNTTNSYSNGIFKSRCEVCNKEDDGNENEQNQGTSIQIKFLVFSISILTGCKMKLPIHTVIVQGVDVDK